MVSFSIDQDMVPNLKLGLHSFQIILSFIAWIMEILVFNDSTSTINGQIGWAFAVCFISVPAWIFLIMTPRWQRSRRFAQPHAMLLVDAVFTVFWLSAFACQAAYNSANLCGGRCGPSQGIVALGVLITLLWAATTFVSVYTLQHYNFAGVLPGYDRRPLNGVSSTNYDPDKTAFSMAPDGDEPYARVDGEDPDHGLGHNGNNLPHAGDDDYMNQHTGYAGMGGSMNSRFGAGDSALDSDLSGGYGAGMSSVSGAGAYPSRGPTPLFDNSRFSPRPDESGYDTGYDPRISSPAVPQHRHHASHGSMGGDVPYDDGPARFPAGNYQI